LESEELEQRTQLKAKDSVFAQLIEEAANYDHIDVVELKTAPKARTVSLASSVPSYLAARQLLYGCTELVCAWNICASAVGKAATMGRTLPAKKIKRKYGRFDFFSGDQLI
jgi:hypothetical protein